MGGYPTANIYCVYREGNGSIALFNIIIAAEFIKANEIVVTDRLNYCLRLINMSTEVATTSIFAGRCTTRGDSDGDRFTSLFDAPKDLEFDNSNQKLYISEHSIKKLKVISLSTGSVQSYTLSRKVRYIKLRSADELYYTNSYQIFSLNLTTLNETVVAGSSTSGSALGSFAATRFDLPLRQTASSTNGIWLIADMNNDRYFNFI